MKAIVAMRAMVAIAAMSAVIAVVRPLSAQSAPATVILVRHSEKALEPKDNPPLSAAGRARAAAVVEMLRHAGVDVVYHSNRVRTHETARSLGDSLHVPLVEVPLTKLDPWVSDIVARVRKDCGGKVCVVVGHSNTYGPVIEAFGGPKIEEIVEERYDDVIILTVQDGKPLRMIRAKYGERWDSSSERKR
jgi:phosphohistidine phosphatase SixA